MIVTKITSEVSEKLREILPELELRNYLNSDAMELELAWSRRVSEHRPFKEISS